MMFSEQRFVPEARASVAAAESWSDRANDRERGLTQAARRLVDGDWDGACRAYDRVLVDHPRDAFAIQTAHLMDFYRGDALNLRNRVSRVLPHWSASVPHYSYIPLLLYSRDAGLWSGGVQPICGRRGGGPQGAGAPAQGWLGRPCRDPCHGNAGPH